MYNLKPNEYIFNIYNLCYIDVYISLSCWLCSSFTNNSYITLYKLRVIWQKFRIEERMNSDSSLVLCTLILKTAWIASPTYTIKPLSPLSLADAHFSTHSLYSTALTRQFLSKLTTRYCMVLIRCLLKLYYSMFSDNCRNKNLAIFSTDY